MNKRDYILIAVAAVILGFLWAAPKESTHRVPFDETHERFYTLVKAEGKKVAEKFCEECHNADGVQFPKDHPPKSRCLLCHKLEER
ncbi:protein of unknown function Dhc2 [Desulfuromonas soudanensis]|uniref:Uncharacterized protein n=1 Tax=Desulfuromonas soudanensis TaxID=1603606 RepID=A0A0M4DFD7_9BACT|nr:hypothetical protein [Desulfuromonas soudanensis]ALC15437.1 protein of unknown function Dhc2 [Desulfuromonas soudanensis]